MNFIKLFALIILMFAFALSAALAVAQTESIKTVAGALTITPVNKVD